jgi:hypothetical protein
MAAEAESQSTEEERRCVVMEDSNFGPDEVGGNFCANHIEIGITDVLKGLIALHKMEVDTECTRE